MAPHDSTRNGEDTGLDWRGRVRGLPVIGATVFGGVAFVLGYALILLLARVGGGLTGSRDPLGLAGLVFYGAHFVSTTLQREVGPQTVDALADLTTTVPTLVYYLVPAAVLTGASYLLVTRYGVGGDRTGRSGARAGAAITLGYLPLVVVGTALFRVTVNFFDPFRSGVWSVDLFSAVVLAGLVYPLAFGALGGYLAVSRPSDRFAASSTNSDRGALSAAGSQPPGPEEPVK